VRSLIEDAFDQLWHVEVRLFDPIGASAAKEMEVHTAKPKMTPGRAAIIKVLDTYRALEYGLSKIEVQKNAYFLQEAGQPLKLSFEAHEYGPYSDQLRHVLNRMEGHYIRGVGDGVVDAEIEPMPNALSEADALLQNEKDGSSLNQRIAKVEQLMEGFQSPYGMELLATVYGVTQNESFAKNHDEALRTVCGWERAQAPVDVTRTC